MTENESLNNDFNKDNTDNNKVQHESGNVIKHLIDKSESTNIPIYPATQDNVYVTTMISSKEFESKDEMEDNMGITWKELKSRTKRADRLKIEVFFKKINGGKIFLPCLANPCNKYVSESKQEFEFVNSNLFVIDVDDEDCLINPNDLMESLSNVCVGLFFTPSHNIKGNRFRLVFIASKMIHSRDTYERVVKELVNDLVDMELPGIDDVQPVFPLQQVRTGYGFIMNPYDRTVTIDVAYYLRKSKEYEEKRIDREVKVEECEMTSNYLILNKENLMKMAHKIGEIEGFDEWKIAGMALKSYVNKGKITDAEGLEIFNVNCKGDESKFWDGLKNPKKVKIGTFIFYYKMAGGKITYDMIKHKSFEAAVERVFPIDKFVEEHIGLSAIEDRLVLFDSGTGTGKTTAFLNIFSKLDKEDYELEVERRNPEHKDKKYRLYNNVFFFSVPTTSLVDQLREECEKEGRKVLAVSGSDAQDGLHKKVMDFYFNENGRIFIMTYDIARNIFDMLHTTSRPNINLKCLVMDETHKTVTELGFRKQALKSLLELKESAKSFIGLSGTTSVIDRSEYAVHYKIEKESGNQIPAKGFATITYEGEDNCIPTLFKLIKEKVKKGKKILCFIQNKEMIDDLKKSLEMANVRVATIDADGKKKKSYGILMEKKIFFESVLLATTAISDGISIINHNSNYECICVCNNKSNLYSPSIIRQMSNRFRNKYNGFYLYIPINNLHKDPTYEFNLDGYYDYQIGVSTQIKEYIERTYKENANDKKLVRLEKLEKEYALFWNDEGELEVDKLELRFKSLQKSEEYYSMYPKKFIEVVGKELSMTCGKIFSTEDIGEIDGDDLRTIEEVQREKKEAKKKVRNESLESFDSYFSENTYSIIKNELDKDESELSSKFKEIRGNMVVEQFKAAMVLSSYLPYQLTKKIVGKVRRKADINAFNNKLEAFASTIYYKKIDRNTISKTRPIYEELARRFEVDTNREEDIKGFTTKELDEIYIEISREYKVSKDDIKKRHHDYFETKNKQVREANGTKTYKNFVHRIDVDNLGRKFGLAEREVECAMWHYAKTNEVETVFKMVCVELEIGEDEFEVRKKGKKISPDNLTMKLIS